MRLTQYSVRCKLCNRDHSALQRLCAKHPEIKESIKEKFSRDENSRAEFTRKARGLVGHDLKALVTTMLQETTSEKNSAKRTRFTEYLDSPDLKRRFIDKPDQLENVKALGVAFVHPDTGAQMYQLTSFTAEHPQHHFGSYD